MRKKRRTSFSPKKSNNKPITLGLIAIILIGCAFFSFINLNDFLSVNQPIDSKILVVEGWIPDTALKEAKKIYLNGHYELLITTGGLLVNGYYLSEYKNYAVLAATTLRKLGMTPGSIQAVPAPDVRMDRTFASAVAVKQWMVRAGIRTKTINLLSYGPHARRSWLLYQKAFEYKKRIGIISISDPAYVPKKWWTTSNGFRTVINEFIGYVYIKTLGKA